MTIDNREPDLQAMKPDIPVGIVGYGAYIPRYRLPAEDVAKLWVGPSNRLPVTEKSVAGIDEDVVTMSIEAARNVLARSDVNPIDIGAVWVGSESHPYAVKPTSTIVAEAIGAVPNTQAADWQFACKAGTEAIQASTGFVGSGMTKYALAIGMDTAQGRPGDALEYTAGAGGAAFLLGTAEESVATIEGSFSFVTDTPDFWRRQNAKYPQHGKRFTGEPAYFKHIAECAEQLMHALGTKPTDYAYAVFHQPNSKFPQQVAKILGFTTEQIATGLLASDVGNVYAGSALLGLTAVLDVAQTGDRILLVSFGSGAGSDAFDLSINERLSSCQTLAPTTKDYIERRTVIDYATYARYRGKLALK